jgi:hypothetical protein
MAKYNVFRPDLHRAGRIVETDALAENYFPKRGYYHLRPEHEMRRHLDDWMVPVSAYPRGSWVPVWLYLLWELSGSSATWRRLVKEFKGDDKKIVSLLMSELLKRKGSATEELMVAIKGCLAKHGRGTT